MPSNDTVIPILDIYLILSTSANYKLQFILTKNAGVSWTSYNISVPDFYIVIWSGGITPQANANGLVLISATSSRLGYTTDYGQTITYPFPAGTEQLIVGYGAGFYTNGLLYVQSVFSLRLKHHHVLHTRITMILL